MSSKEIIGNYLDKDLFDAVGEKTIEKIIRSNSNLSGTEVKLMSLILQRKHDMTSMERVRDDVSELNLVHTTESEAGIKSDFSDDNVHNLIQKLNTLNEIIQTNVNGLKDERSELVDQIESMVLNTSSSLSDLDYTSITKEVYEHISKSI